MFNEIGQVPARGIAILTSKFPTLSPISKRILSVFFQTLGKTLLCTSMGVIPFLTIKNSLASLGMKTLGWVAITASAILIIQCAVAGVMEILKLRKQRQHIQEIIFIAKTLEGFLKNDSYTSYLKALAKRYEARNYDDLISLEEVSRELQATYKMLKEEHPDWYEEIKDQIDCYSAKVDRILGKIAIFQSELAQAEMKKIDFKDDKDKLRCVELKLNSYKSSKSKLHIELNEILIDTNISLLQNNIVLL